MAAQGPPDEAIVEMLGMYKELTEALIKQATQNNMDVLHHERFIALGGREDKSWPDYRPEDEINALRDFLREYCVSQNLPSLGAESTQGAV